MSYAITIYLFYASLAQAVVVAMRDEGADDKAIGIMACLFTASAGYWCVQHIWGVK